MKELLNKLNEEKEITQGLDRENCSDIVREMINVIEESYGMKLQLDVIAEKFHMTPEYLGNLFAKETGITFSNYLRQVRMEKAKELLTGTDMKIYEVACAVGYPDQKYFSKVFKEYGGGVCQTVCFENCKIITLFFRKIEFFLVLLTAILQLQQREQNIIRR